MAKPNRKTEVPEYVFRETGILFAVACSSLSKKETVRRAHTELCGTTGGWQLAEDDSLPNDVEANPWPCDDHPKTHKHYLFVC